MPLITLQDEELARAMRRCYKKINDFFEGPPKLILEDPGLLQKINDFFETGKKPLYLKRGLKKEFIEALYAWAYNLYTESRFKEAGRVFWMMAFYSNLDKRAWMGVGASFQQIKQYKMALKGYSESSKLDLENPVPYFHSYECYLGLNQISQAMEELEKALIISEHYPQYAEIYKRVVQIKNQFPIKRNK